MFRSDRPTVTSLCWGCKQQYNYFCPTRLYIFFIWKVTRRILKTDVFCMYVCMYACMYVFMYACTYACMYVRMYAYMYVLCMYVCGCVCMYILCMYLCICLCVCVCYFLNIRSDNLAYLLTYLLTYLLYLLSSLLIYLLTPWRRDILEKLTGSQLVKKFPAFCGTQRFITAFVSSRHLSLS